MGEAFRTESETYFREGVKSQVRTSRAAEINSAAVVVEEDGVPHVVLILDKREQRQRQQPLRLVKSMRHAMSPAAARHLAQLLVMAADRIEPADG